MSSIGALLGRTLRTRWAFCVLAGIGTVIALQLAQLALMIARLGTWPNYVVLHDWLGAMATIVRHTPSPVDMLEIAADEWLIEIGYINYAWGHGISEWSVVLLPARAVAVFAMGFLASLTVVVLRQGRSACARPGWDSGAAVGLGSAVTALANLTMTWVVCCAAPTWVVGLAMLGLGVTTSLALIPLGPWLDAAGFLLLLAGLLAALLRGTSAMAPLQPTEVACSPASSR